LEADADTRAKAETEEFYAAIGRLTLAFSALDIFMSGVLSRLMPKEPDENALGIASVFIYAARSTDQKQEILTKAFDFRLSDMLNEHKNATRRRAAEFISGMMKRVFANINAKSKIRNLAAHGDAVFDDIRHYLGPPMLQGARLERLQKMDCESPSGFTAAELDKVTAKIRFDGFRFDGSCLQQLGTCILYLRKMDSGLQPFLSAANGLAKLLGAVPLTLHDPSNGPPMRGKRQR
jgi:hypothetical protein